ncbi:seroin-like [Battus philenor]|uniref:seroin-like n=1 Tax=Battus philenor TaxID=42288 RepID=UPI0035D0D2F0
MAYLVLFTTIALLIGAHADSSDDDNNPFQGFPFGQFPNLHFPNIHFPAIPFPKFQPIIPPFPTIKIPSADEIISKNPQPGESYSGIVVHSSNGYTTDENGNVIKTGGTTVVTNDNGEIKEYKVGNNPPDIKSNAVPPFKHPKVPKVLPLPLLFPQIKLISLHPEDLKKVEPAANRNFIGSSSSSFSVSSSENGKNKYAGATKTVVNNNGQVDEQTLILENNII